MKRRQTTRIAEFRQLEQLAEAGFAQSEIARMLHRTRSWVAYWTRRGSLRVVSKQRRGGHSTLAEMARIESWEAASRGMLR